MSSSSTPTQTPERDQQMLSIGRQCSHPSCLLVDFLPFKCQHCANSFCADHFKPVSHSCSKYDESKYNRVAPDCEPTLQRACSHSSREDPNIRMEHHLTRDCSVMTGRSLKTSSAPKCSRPKCGKVLFARIQCDKCFQRFCPEHRFPSSHNCISLSSSSTSNLIANIPSKASSQASTTSAGGLAAIKRAAASAKSMTSSPSTKFSAVPVLPAAKESAPSPGAVTSGPKPNTSVHNPFSKADRRSRQEKESQIRAMRARAQKGLLSEDEKVILASLEAERAHGHGDKDCVVM
ncbi:hypothetical protein B0F90DRAFT_1809310 [Multifurca ochricompacta]|uniref:AN1-type domain-containing protein n=1 Tax=Multifurca ochricompacta TaxID=376703 RepID=A0AAD4QMR6_9AGAM|nr:hypothetical protein B0F90DRAFT_1809310 [Multifurca ochricompacta]